MATGTCGVTTPALEMEGKNPFTLDSKTPDWDKFEDFLKGRGALHVGCEAVSPMKLPNCLPQLRPTHSGVITTTCAFRSSSGV